MKKILLFLTTVFASLLTMSAQTFEAGGIYYKVLSEAESVCSVTYPSTGQTLYSGEIIIPEKVLYNEKSYQVTSVDAYAFSESPELTGVTLPSSVNSLGRNSFSDCGALQKVSLPLTLKDLPQSCFLGCSSITGVALPGQLETIGASAFSGCSSLSSIGIPASVVTIGDGAFQRCSTLEEIKLPDNVKMLGEGAFKDCSALVSIEFPESLSEIPANSCLACTSLSNLILPSSLYTIGENAFRGCTSLAEVTFPSSLQKIENHAFELCTELGDINFETENLEIGDFGFSSCYSLRNINLKGVVKIGANSFASDKALESVIFCPDLRLVGSYAFAGSSSIESVYCHPEIPPTLPPTAFENDVYSMATLYVVMGFGELYRQTPSWSLFVSVEDTLVDSGIEDVESDRLVISINHEGVLISGVEGSVPYSIFSVTGQVVREGTIGAGETISGLSPGQLYILKIKERTVKFTL